MSSSLRRGALAASALALSIASLASCAAGSEAERNLVTRPDDVSARAGALEFHGITIVTAEDGSGAAAVTGRIFNEGNEDRTLEAVTVDGSDAAVRLSPAEGGNLTVPAGGSLALGGEGNAAVLIPDAERAGIEEGANQRLAFELSTVGGVEMVAPVFPAAHEWEGYGPSTAPSPAGGTASPAASPTASPESEVGAESGADTEDESDH